MYLLILLRPLPLMVLLASITLGPLILIDINEPSDCLSYRELWLAEESTTQLLSDARWIGSPSAIVACWKSLCVAGMSLP